MKELLIFIRVQFLIRFDLFFGPVDDIVGRVGIFCWAFIFGDRVWNKNIGLDLQAFE